MMDPPSTLQSQLVTTFKSRGFIPISDTFSITAASPHATMRGEFRVSAKPEPPAGRAKVFAHWFYRRRGGIWTQVHLSAASDPDCEVGFDDSLGGYYILAGDLVFEANKGDLTAGGIYEFKLDGRSETGEHTVTLAGRIEITS